MVLPRQIAKSTICCCEAVSPSTARQGRCAEAISTYTDKAHKFGDCFVAQNAPRKDIFLTWE